MDTENILKTFNEISNNILRYSNIGYANYMTDAMKIYNFCEAEKKAEIVDKENQLGFNF